MKIMDIHTALAVTIFDTGISCPRDYSEEEIERIEKTEDNLPATNEKNQPNILFLQLESFFDPTLVNYLKISEDPIPTFPQADERVFIRILQGSGRRSRYCKYGV